MSDLPPDVEALIGVRQYEETAEFPVERGYIWNTCAAVQNGNPLFWDDAVADAVTGGPIAPPTTLSLWMRPHYWSPGHAGERLALRVHFDMKARFDLPEAIIGDNTLVFYEPVRPGDVITHAQVLRSVSDVKTLTSAPAAGGTSTSSTGTSRARRSAWSPTPASATGSRASDARSG